MGDRSKLEPTLAALVDPAIPEMMPAADTLYLLVQFTGSVEDLTAAGLDVSTVLTHPTDGYSIAAGTIPWADLDALEAVPHVVFIEGSRSERNELNHSVSEIHADVLHDSGLLGTNVIIGIIDGGIDFTHRSFRNPDGSTRIRGLWDQTSGGTTGPGGIGTEYTQRDIDATLQFLEDQTPMPAGTTTVTETDPDGHGSHVAGIAAGNGHPAGNCRGDGVYVGVAPDAGLLVVKRAGALEIGEAPSLAAALDWIWHHPASALRGVVVNMSFGDSRGPHDGTSLVERAIEVEVLNQPGHVVVKSAGNMGDRARHAASTVPANNFLDLPFSIDGRDVRNTHHMELWYGAGGQLDVTVLGVPPVSGNRPTSPVLTAGAVQPPWRVNPTAPLPRQQIVIMKSRLQDPRNNDNVISVDLVAPGGMQAMAGAWALHLVNHSGQPVPFHAWIDGEEPYGADFTSFVTRDCSLTEPGTSKGVITVGAYATGGFWYWDSSGDLSDFSSYGPTRDGRPKPDIAAPGQKITSVKAAANNGCCCDCCYDAYADTTPGPEAGPFSGTSMAAPHVTGVVALMLQHDQSMSAADVTRQIILTARTPDGVDKATLPDNHWGGGKVNANDAVTKPLPPAPPMPGPAPAPHAAPSPTPVPAPAPAPGPVPLARPADAALELPEVQYWAALVSRHFSEVRGLINSNKWVSCCWHRMDGPALVHALRHALLDPIALAPMVQEWRPWAARFLDMLERFGSPALASAAAANRETILSVEPAELIDLARALAVDPAA